MIGGSHSLSFAGLALAAATAAALQLPLVMDQCLHDQTQQLTCYETCSGPRHLTPTHGMNQFLHSPGNCLVGNSSTLKMYVAPCNISDRNQRFATAAAAGPGEYLWQMNPEHENKITYCITANCTIINASSVDCTKGMQIALAKCEPDWPGSPLPNIPNPLQVWSVGGHGVSPGVAKLARSWNPADHPKHGIQKQNSTSCLTAAGFLPVPPPPATPPLPPAPPVTPGELVVQQCTDAAGQELTCYQNCSTPRHLLPSHGMNQFLHHPGNCLAGSLEDKLVHMVPCNLSDRNQRWAEAAAGHGTQFMMNPERENPITYCITANCSISNTTSVDCAAGARIGLAPCTNSWVGSTLPGIPDPRQIWSRGADTEPGALKLEYTWIASDHPKNKPAKKESTSCLTLVAN